MAQRFTERLKLAKANNVDSSTMSESEIIAVVELLGENDLKDLILKNRLNINNAYKKKDSFHSLGGLLRNENYVQIFKDCFEDLFKDHPVVTRKTRRE